MAADIIVKDNYNIKENEYIPKSRKYRFPELIIDSNYLSKNVNHIFVFGDNLLRRGKGGAAALRDFPNTYGFITKKEPNNNITSFYKSDEYSSVFANEYLKLENLITKLPFKVFLISKLGAGLANKFCIFENVIQSPMIALAERYNNVYLLW